MFSLVENLKSPMSKHNAEESSYKSDICDTGFSSATNI